MLLMLLRIKGRGRGGEEVVRGWVRKPAVEEDTLEVSAAGRARKAVTILRWGRSRPAATSIATITSTRSAASAATVVAVAIIIAVAVANAVLAAQKRLQVGQRGALVHHDVLVHDEYLEEE